jgi:hypothetical protein
LRDAGPVIRDMLREQGFPAAGPDASEAEEFTTVLRAVAADGVQTGEFFTFFMRVVPAWEQQDELQRPLMVLLSDWAEETASESRSAIAAAVRRVPVTLREVRLLGLKRQVNQMGNRPRGTSSVTAGAASDRGLSPRAQMASLRHRRPLPALGGD